MNELVLKSHLSQEEIEKNFQDCDPFTGLMEGLNEALAYERGTAKAETFARKRSLPQVDIKDLRKGLQMSQKSFAKVLGVSTRTVEAWEAGRSNPTPTAHNLLFLIKEDPSLIAKLQG